MLDVQALNHFILYVNQCTSQQNVYITQLVQTVFSELILATTSNNTTT